MRHLALMCTILAAAPTMASAQNFVLNPDFTTDTANWVEANQPTTTTPGYVFVRDADSGVGTPLGSVDIRYSNPPGATFGEFSIWTNCMAITPNTMLSFGGMRKATAGGTANLALLVWDNAICSSGLSFNLGTSVGTVAGTLDGGAAVFDNITGTITTGASAQSMQMFLSTAPPMQNQLSRTVYDRIYVVREVIFKDGFQ